MSFLACCDAMGALTKAKHGQLSYNDLAKYIKLHIDCHWTAYCDVECEMVKFHWALHLPAQLETDGVLYDCWTCERKHGTAKQIADHIDNTAAFEKTVLSRVWQSQMSMLQNESGRYFMDRLVQPSEVDIDDIAAVVQVHLLLGGECTVHASLQVRIKGLIVGHGDFIKFGDGSAAFLQIVYEAVEYRRIFAVVAFCDWVGKNGATTIWRRSDNTTTIELLNIECLLVWREMGGRIEALGFDL